MTQVSYARKGKTHRLTLKGHAGGGESGGNIVCAGVSALAFSLLGYLENHREELKELSNQVEKGEVRVYAEGDGQEPVFELTLTGLGQIARKYPDLVAIHSLMAEI